MQKLRNEITEWWNSEMKEKDIHVQTMNVMAFNSFAFLAIGMFFSRNLGLFVLSSGITVFLTIYFLPSKMEIVDAWHLEMLEDEEGTYVHEERL